MRRETIRGDGNLYEQAKARSLTRRDFLLAGAGAGLVVIGLGGLGPGGVARAQTAPGGLDIFTKGHPRAFFHRVAEGEARQGELSYAEWAARYKPLNGIVGKVLNEAHYYEERNNLTFFLRYKNQNPTKMVLLHYNGTGRRATDEVATKFFPGHFLYYKGTTLTRPISTRTQKVLHVADTSVFRMRRYRLALPDDVTIARMGTGGKPNWETAEHVRLERIDRRNSTITVRRHLYGSRSSTFPRGSYLAAHGTTGPYRFDNAPQNNIPLWMYNFSTTCPKDAQGRNCGQALADYLGEKFAPDGVLASFDGIVFDVFSWRMRFGHPIQDLDVNTDGRADRGVIAGVNTVSMGALEFLQALRGRLGPDKLILADGHIPQESQRGFGHLNGVESEGYPDKYDIQLDHLSRGENIFRYWKQTSPAPSLNYMTFKYKQRKPERYRNTFVEPNLSEDRSYKKLRLALASAVFTETAFTAAVGDVLQDGDGWMPPEVLWEQGGNARVRVFDELWKGTAQQPNWLGQPLGEAVHLAERAPDLLGGQGESWPEAFVSRFTGEGVAFARAGTEASPVLAVRSTSISRPPAMSFTLPGLQVTGDLLVSLRLRAEPLEGFPVSVPRRVDVHAVPSGSSDLNPDHREFTWAGEEFFSAWLYYQDLGTRTVQLRFEVEGEGRLYIQRIAAHSATDARYREFENGIVFANPSNRGFTFDLASLFPGVGLKRIQGTPRQDPLTNNGDPLGDTLRLTSKDALFVAKV